MDQFSWTSSRKVIQEDPVLVVLVNVGRGSGDLEEGEVALGPQLDVLRGRVQDARRRLRVVRRIVELLLSAQPPPERGETGAKPRQREEAFGSRKKAGGAAVYPSGEKMAPERRRFRGQLLLDQPLVFCSNEGVRRQACCVRIRRARG